MKPAFTTHARRISFAWLFFLLWTMGGNPSLARAIELEGFAEPLHTVNVAADESGIIQNVLVSEGQTVTAGQDLVRLNSDVHEALLAIAEQNMNTRGRLDAARADLQMRRERLTKLRSLRIEGHARQEEVDRAVSEVAVAEANVLTAQEDLLSRRLEYDKIRTQIARRTVRAPISGVVTTLQKVAGEFVAPNSPEVLTMVCIDTLLANFTLLNSQAAQIRPGQEVKVRFHDSGSVATGKVDYISPVTDAESGTVLVKIRIDNAQGRYRSGERCMIRIGN